MTPLTDTLPTGKVRAWNEDKSVSLVGVIVWVTDRTDEGKKKAVCIGEGDLILTDVKYYEL